MIRSLRLAPWCWLFLLSFFFCPFSLARAALEPETTQPYHLQVVLRMAEEAGFTVCDLIVKIRTGPMLSDKWKEAHHARKRHCFWIVCRNSASCER